MVYLGFAYTIGTHGGGTHQWNLHEASVQYQKKVSHDTMTLDGSKYHRDPHITTNQYTNYSDPIYSVSLLATKCSILLLILRIFCSVKRDLGYWLTIGLIVVNTIFYTVFFFVPIFLCSPRVKIWDDKVPGRCLNIDALYLASATFNMVSDVAMLSVPLWLIWNLQMSVERKVGASAIFATGSLSVSMRSLRIGTLWGGVLTVLSERAYLASYAWYIM